MNEYKKVSKIMNESSHLNDYIKIRNKREKFKNLYKSEKYIFKKFLKKNYSVLDIGCLFGSLSLSLKKFKVKYSGLDNDKNAIKYGKKIFKNIDIHYDNFLKPKKKYKKCDFVFALNVFEHFENWKNVILSLRKFSKKYICFTSNFRLEGNTVLDKDVSYTHYPSPKRLLWSVHNIFELIAYLSTFEIGSKKIFIYAYHKYNKKNFQTAAFSCHPIDPRNLLIGMVVAEIDEDFKKKNKKTYKRASIEIIIDDKKYYKSQWKQN